MQVLFCKLTTEQRDMYRAYLASKVSDAISDTLPGSTTVSTRATGGAQRAM